MFLSKTFKSKLNTIYLLVCRPNVLQNLLGDQTHTLAAHSLFVLGLDFLRVLIPHSFQERPLLLVEDLQITRKNTKITEETGKKVFLELLCTLSQGHSSPCLSTQAKK